MRKVSLLIAGILAITLIYTYWPQGDAVSGPSDSVADGAPTQELLVPVDGGALYEVVAGESMSRYLVQEQLAGMSLPIDAVGMTSNISGRVGFDASGAVVDGSEIWVNLASLQSDQSRRDNYVRSNILQTEAYPVAIFVPKKVRGLPHPIPTSGAADITITGDLTIRDITRPVEWHGTATFADDHLAVSAKVAFPFGEFGLPQPRVAVVLSVADEIRLEADLRLVKVG